MYPRLDNKMATLVTGIKEVLHIAVMEVKSIHVMVPIKRGVSFGCQHGSN